MNFNLLSKPDLLLGFPLEAGFIFGPDFGFRLVPDPLLHRHSGLFFGLQTSNLVALVDQQDMLFALSLFLRPLPQLLVQFVFIFQMHLRLQFLANLLLHLPALGDSLLEPCRLLGHARLVLGLHALLDLFQRLMLELPLGALFSLLHPLLRSLAFRLELLLLLLVDPCEQFPLLLLQLLPQLRLRFLLRVLFDLLNLLLQGFFLGLDGFFPSSLLFKKLLF